MKTVAIATFTALTLTSASLIPSARAGDREWSLAGKVLTGVFAAGVIAHAVAPPPPPVVYQAPPVYVVPPPPVYVPAPVVVAGPPVAYYYPAPSPVYVQAPVYIIPGPVYGHRPVHHHGFRATFCR